VDFKISRRQFLQYCTASAAALGLSQLDLLKLEKALATPQTGCSSLGAVSVIYMVGQACSGCQTSLLNRVVDVTGGYYDSELLDALYGCCHGDGTPQDPEAELHYVNDAADLFVGDAVGALVPSVRAARHLPWADDAAGVGLIPSPNAFPGGYVTLEWLTTVMASAGDIPLTHMASIVNGSAPWVLVVDGAIPTYPMAGATRTKNEKYCLVFDNEDAQGNGPLVVDTKLPYNPAYPSVTMAQAMRWMAPKAAAVIAQGTCASWGGVPGAKGNRTGAISVPDFFAQEGITTPVIRVPGCPPHPDWTVYPIAWILIHSTASPLSLSLPALTGDARPSQIYKQANCASCSKSGLGFANCLGEDGCMQYIGCKGPAVLADCSERLKNNFDNGTVGNNWCVGEPDAPGTTGIGDARHPCQGCTEQSFPDWPDGFYAKTTPCTNCTR
jgi:hydrogenase small subunit